MVRTGAAVAALGAVCGAFGAMCAYYLWWRVQASRGGDGDA